MGGRAVNSVTGVFDARDARGVGADCHRDPHHAIAAGPAGGRPRACAARNNFG